MRKWIRIITLIGILSALMLTSPLKVASKVGPAALLNCRDFAFSTEEDFVTQGPEPADGNPIISDGDLLGIGKDATGATKCFICARNADLLLDFDVSVDLGLDAADVINVDSYLVAFSTELDSPHGNQFMAGDLLVTNGHVIPNIALTNKFIVGYDLGLDATHFVGSQNQIEKFLEAALQYSRADYLADLDLLATLLTESSVDIWFSTEGTFTKDEVTVFLDGDLLSARDGIIVADNSALLPASVPAGIPQRGVDFGLDAVTGPRETDRPNTHFSTEILFRGEPSFTDGDVLKIGNGVIAVNNDLIHCFEPKVKELGLDALFSSVPSEQPCVSRIDRIAGIDIADIDPLNGMAIPGAVGIMAYVPFGGRIDIQGNICDDVEYFRIVYRKEGTSDPWEPIKVEIPKNWTVKVDSFIPPWPDCLGLQNWASDANGWFAAPDYRSLTDVSFGCNPDLALTVWESTAAVAGAEDLYELLLETHTSTSTISDTVRLVQLDNTAPEVALAKTVATCDSYNSTEMPLMVTGRMSDTHFYRYRLAITGNGYGIHYYSPIAFYDDATDNVIDTGTINWDNDVDLSEVDVADLATNPIACCYTALLTGWDRTRACNFTYTSNVRSCCNGCRHTGDAWSFQYTTP